MKKPFPFKNPVNVRHLQKDYMKYLANLRYYLIIIIALGFVLHALHFNFFVCDDAFISYRYAKNFINGHGLVWNVGEQPPSEGYTSFLWVMVIGLFMKMGFEPVIVSKIVNICFGVCCIFFTYLFSELILQRQSLLNIIAPAILALNGPFVSWSVEGLETQMFTFFIITSTITYLREIQSNKVFPLSAIFFVLASLTRPEGVLIFGITCLHRFLYQLWLKRNPLSRETIIWLSTFIIIYGLYFCWRFSYYGFIFPNTFYAKTGGGIYQYWRGFKYLCRFIIYSKWPVLIILSLPIIFNTLTSPLTYLIMLSASFTLYIILIGGDFFAMFRFFVPIVPLMAIVVQEGVINFNQWFPKIGRPLFLKKPLVTFCYFIFILLIFSSCIYSFRGRELMNYFLHQRVAMAHVSRGKWLKQHASFHETVASIGIGAISYYSELKTFDILGITDVHVAHTKMPSMGRGTAGHEKRNWSYILSKQPTYISGNIYPTKRQFFKPSSDEIERFHQLYEPLDIEGTNPLFPFYRLKKKY